MIMTFNKILRIPKHPLGADKSAVGAINRPLQRAGVFCSFALSSLPCCQAIEQECGCCEHDDSGEHHTQVCHPAHRLATHDFAIIAYNDQVDDEDGRKHAV